MPEAMSQARIARSRVQMGKAPQERRLATATRERQLAAPTPLTVLRQEVGFPDTSTF